MRKYDAWILREKNGDWWMGTVSVLKEDTERHLKQIGGKTAKELGLRPVRIRFVEVEDTHREPHTRGDGSIR
jgi:hypothetical protein